METVHEQTMAGYDNSVVIAYNL